ncbi:heterokaryon incompatibility protein-domain-containing protein [Podospora aff. communis PSN243]|uniref:Heterokaryon incompatibility protein-domain-containing protein n=1 Tax=Podospora aff. communis PSN243 TaxID=3040156 RepID=A0AAV9G0D2_9PEZI|nr:heterokaryon incompatibility protein-domain-containing protein [Podospora aff. communis PSN243]
MRRNFIAPDDTCNRCGWSLSTSQQCLTPRASLVNLRESAFHGCPRCGLLARVVMCFEGHWNGTDEGLVMVRCHPQGRSGVGVRVLWPLEPDESNRRDAKQIGIEIYPEKLPDIPWLHFSHRRIPAPAEDGSLEFLRAMMHNCVSSHDCCNISDPGTRSPTRLLQIVDFDQGQERRVYLTTTSPTMSYQYTALSHCWGSPDEAKKMPKTTRDNFLRQQQDGIPVSHLTRTFQDSIDLTVQLSLEYIWIDSLCIIQGDAADWAIESVTMASVYGGAHLVIAATCGKDGNDGLYPPPNPLRHIELPLAIGESQSTSGSVRLSIKSFNPGDWNHQTWQFGTWTPSSDSGLPLHKRAWTFQERLLAKRIVHFTPLEMIWECWTSSSCECGELQDEGSRKVYPGAKSKHRGAILDSGVQERLQAWDGVIAGYSVRDITYYQDRVQAIAGIALQFDSGKELSGLGRYLCGIWEVDLPTGLLWYSLLVNRKQKQPHGSVHRRLRGWTVPTWSWLSVQGDVSHADREGIEMPLASIVGLSYRTSTENPYGAPLDTPMLTVRGLAVDVEMQHDDDGTFGADYFVSHQLLEDSAPLEADVNVMDVPLDQSRVKALRITTREESDAMNCLLVCEQGSGTYERVGIASVANELFEKCGIEEDIVLV